MKLKKLLMLLSIFSLFSIQLFAQNSVSLPEGYDEIKLGYSVEQVKELLKKNSIYGYRGERDVSLLPTQERVLIETPGSSLFNRCWFQFYENKLYAITININTDKMDYYSLFTTLSDKYGKPQDFTNKKAEWKNDKVIFTLEKPLTVKYLDVSVYTKIVGEDVQVKTRESVLREEFLKTF